MLESQRAARSSRFPPVIVDQVVLPVCIGFQALPASYINSISLIPRRSPTTSNSPRRSTRHSPAAGRPPIIANAYRSPRLGSSCNKAPNLKPRNGRSTVNSQGNVSTQGPRRSCIWRNRLGLRGNRLRDYVFGGESHWRKTVQMDCRESTWRHGSRSRIDKTGSACLSGR